jgi:hypothetical protein
MNQLIKRRDATKRTLDAWRGVTFDWTQPATCVHLARSHLVELGYDLPPIPEFDTALGAARAMREHGWDSVSDMLDSLLERRPGAAFMMLGDLALIKGAGGLDAIFICAGPLKVFGWREDEPDLVLLDVGLGELEAAWKV